MRSANSFLGRLPLVLRVIVAIPWTIFWAVFAVIVAPFQMAYHSSGAGKQLGSTLNRDRADQDFKKAIAFIELHKVRFGRYPENFQEETFQEFIGAWDNFICKNIAYSRLENGYELNLNSQESIQLEYPIELWKNLGLTKTNVGGFQS